MDGLMRAAVAAAALALPAYPAAQAVVLQQGRATVEYRSPEVNAVAAYDYSQRNHRGPWLLVELAVQTKARVAIHRDQISLLTPDERIIRVASQQQYLDDHAVLTQLLQNASVTRQPLSPYFRTPPQPTIRFFASPGRIVHDDFVSNQDEVAAGDLLFVSPTGRWAAGTYRLRISHERARVELPIELR
jgi:hypothetical protein